MTRSSLASALRVVIFSDVNGPVSATLVADTLRIAREHPGLEVAGIVTTNPSAFAGGRVQGALRFGRRLLVALANAEIPLAITTSPRLDLWRVQHDHGIRVLVPEGGDPNDPRFLRRLDRELDADVALSFYCLSVFKRELLDRFEQCVNYHDSLLPAHRGLLATSFSVYEGDLTTGFSYHRMTEEVDGGPILVQGEVPIRPTAPLAVVKQRKLAAATAALPEVLEMVVGGAPGREQPAAGGYHSRHDVDALLHVESPEALDSRELQRRIGAFGAVHLTIDGVKYPVTRLRPAVRRSALSFMAADGVALAADRLAGLPVGLYRLAQVLERSRLGPAPTPAPRRAAGDHHGSHERGIPAELDQPSVATEAQPRRRAA